MFLFLTSNEIFLYLRKNQQVMPDYRNELLNKSTWAEREVCKNLDRLGIKFIRQYPIKTPHKQYYLDIYIPSLKLAIEVDGKYHFTNKQKRLDANRSANIRKKGISVWRITNSNAAKLKSVISLLKGHIRRKNR